MHVSAVGNQQYGLPIISGLHKQDLHVLHLQIKCVVALVQHILENIVRGETLLVHSFDVLG